MIFIQIISVKLFRLVEITPRVHSICNPEGENLIGPGKARYIKVKPTGGLRVSKGCLYIGQRHPCLNIRDLLLRRDNGMVRVLLSTREGRNCVEKKEYKQKDDQR